MRPENRRIMASIAATLVALSAAGSVGAAPSPDDNPNALAITFDCGDENIVGMTILQNAAVAVQTVDGPGAVGQIIELWSYSDASRTLDETLWYTTPGFDANGSDSTTCTWENALYPDLFWRGELVLRPGH